MRRAVLGLSSYCECLLALSLSATFLWSTLLFLTSCFTLESSADGHFLFGENLQIKSSPDLVLQIKTCSND